MNTLLDNMLDNLQGNHLDILKIKLSSSRKRLNQIVKALAAFEKVVNINSDKSCYNLRRLADEADLPHIKSVYINQITRTFNEASELLILLSTEDEIYLDLYKITISEMLARKASEFQITI
jgi:hypothetical protein